MRTLLDTCVVSEMKRSDGNPLVRTAVAQLGQQNLFVSAISLGEVQKGISLLSAGQRRLDLDRWFRDVMEGYADHILPIDLDTALVWGDLCARPQFRGRHRLSVDLLIAATAIVHGMSVMTRNTKDFAETGVALIDPWQEIA